MGDQFDETTEHYHAVIGNDENFWLYDSRTGFDLTHAPMPNSPPITPRITIQTTTSPITIDPAKTVLVIIDMQNFFLSPALGRSRGPGHDAADQLVQYAIPAARKAGIQIAWLNWGLTDQDIERMPPGVVRPFGFEGHRGDERIFLDRHGKVQRDGGPYAYADGQRRAPRGFGGAMGIVIDPESQAELDAGKLLMRDQWNTQLFRPLDKLYEEGKKMSTKPDAWIHKDRMSGMWTSSTDMAQFLARSNLRTCLFAGVNTDQCVSGTLSDAFSKGFDCIMLNDGCGTTSPHFAQQTVEFNMANTMGFQTTCRAFAEGVSGIGTK